MDYLIDLLEQVEGLADRHHQGLFCIHRNSTGWSACFGSINDPSTRWYPGKSMEGALRALISVETKSERR